MEEKTLELKKNDRITKAKHIREGEQEKIHTGGTKFGKRKTQKRRTDTKNGKVRRQTKNQNDGEKTMQILRIGHHYTNVQQ